MLAVALLAAHLSAPGPLAQEAQATFRVRVASSAVARTDAPVSARLPAGDLGRPVRAELRPAGGGAAIPAQVERRPDALLVHWVAPRLEAGHPVEYRLELRAGEAEPGPGAFRFAAGDGHRDLLHGDEPVWREVTRFDPGDLERTSKTFHHLFGLHGEGVLTKGPGGLYSHHRGLFVGWSKTRAADGSWDFWHCKDATVRHRGSLAARELAGPVLARSAARIEWIDGGGRAVVREQREVTVWRQRPGRRLLDVAVTLEAAAGTVELDGDPHHAGVQLRFDPDGADARTGMVFVRPAAATGGENDVWTDCAWAAGRFEKAGHAYAALHMDHPDNPRPSSYSTRPYGRFGAFCRGTLEPDRPLRLRYRILLVDAGQHPDVGREALAAEYAAYREPLDVAVEPLR